ncbi:MAG: 50S ribosomal protein L29 [Elusimicrobiales bacterium]|jgi:large subunit ribosomal protein L29|nr:50S ribosomal protein L29 [Elusimicrobiales bacterium]
MKRRDKESIKNLKDDELLSQIEDLKKTVFQIHFKRTTAPVENPVEARTARRKIALMKTILRQRELEKQTPAENK